MPGCTHERRRHALSVRSSLQCILYMFAVGPPTSVMTPREALHARERAHLAEHALGSLRLWMMRPSCSVMLQNVQPPKQPRMVTIECFTVSNAGMRSPR